MKKQIFILLIFLFPFIISVQARKKNIPIQNTSTPISNIKKDAVKPELFALYKPEDVGMNSATLNRIDSIVENGIHVMAFPGCQVLVMRNGKIVYDKCFGSYTYESTQKVLPNTMYDLASLSKTTGTLLAIMKLYDDGRLSLTDKASKYLTFLQGTNKENITIKELLFHESGLPASLPFHLLAVDKNNTSYNRGKDTTNYVYAATPSIKFKQNWVSNIPSSAFPLQVSDSLYVSNSLHEAAMKMIANTHLYSKTYVYSCVNFILLKEIAETITGIPMDLFLEKEFYIPMRINNLCYLPLRTHKKEEIAPTLQRDFLRKGVIQGYVHDPDAAFLGGVSGNAGLFGSAHDVATVYQMILNNGELDGKCYLSEETCRIFTTTTSDSGRRCLGFDKSIPSNPKHSPCCACAPANVFGHTGYTGTCCWVDPTNKLVYVFLSNRTYPNDGINKLAKMNIRTNIQELIYKSIQ